MEILVNDQIGEILDMYEISENDLEKVKKFIKERPHLVSILLEAKEQIIAIFGNETKICLELHHDPEEAWDELFIVIKSPYNYKEAVKLQNKLAKGWFLQRIRDTKGVLNFSEEPL